MFLCYCLQVSSQKADYQTFENIGLGTEASVISCFLQDTQGLIWIGSDKGLFSYDDYSVQHSTIYSVIHSKDDCIYIGTYDGFCRYIPATDTFERINLPVNTRKANQFVNALLEDT